MSTSPRPRTDRAPFLLLLSLCLAGLLTGATPGFAQTCSEGSPAKTTHQNLHGSLRPGPLHELRDSTDYTGNNLPNSSRPLYLSVDAENGWVFTSYATGFHIWNTSADPENPPSKATLDIRSGSGCTPSNAWPVTPYCTELKHFFWDIDAPAGKDDIFALAGITPVGLSIVKWPTENGSKVSPSVAYQDTGKGSTPAGSQVYAATLGGRDYAFYATNQGSTGIFLYDMTSARSLTKCAENTDTEAGKCPGVFRGRIGAGAPTVYLDGVETSSGEHYVVGSSGGFSSDDKGIEIWNVTNPLAPSNVHASGGRFLTHQISSGVAMWEQGNRQYVATHVGGGAQIYDVTSCLANGCTSLGNPIWSGSWSTYGKAPLGADRLYVTFSRSNDRPFLYFGSNDQCSGGRQREFLFDVGNASNPNEITPDGTIDIEGKAIDYWGWYYSGNNPSTGFSRVMPMVAKFSGSVLYRAAQTVFDTHVWTNSVPVPPVANFTWSPSTVYKGEQVTFTDTSTGTVTSRVWTFPADASLPSPSGTSSPAVTSFSQEGTKSVTLKATNEAGSHSKTLNVEVLDPSPKFGSITHSPANPQTCQDVTFSVNVTGFPSPGVTWVVKDQGGTQVYPQVGQAGQPLKLPANTLAAAAYTAVFTATNAAGTTTADPHAFTISNPPALGFNGAPVCSNCTDGSPPFGSVNLSVSATGATGYSWDFGDGVFRGAANNEAQYNTPTPTFSYGEAGTKTIKAQIHGCSGVQVSQALTVEIKNVDPLLIDEFEAICAFNPCGFGTNSPISFQVAVSGTPTGYEFDWDGNGSFEDTTSKPADGIVTHSYAVAGTYKPVLRIRRGAETVTSPPHFPINVSGGQNPPPPPPGPSISISGPTTGQPNAALTFTASASNCTPAATWNWNGGGGTVTGTGSSVTIVWTSTGTKTISVTNSGCSGASGSRSVSISDGNTGGGGGLGANFSWTPASPNVGQAVTFDGGSSTGAPTLYTWDFGGGVVKSGKTVTHTFGASGPFTVKLEVGKSGDCALGLCTATTSKQVTVAGGPPPLSASFNTSATCVAEFGPSVCTAQAGQAVTFTSTSTGDPTSWAWTFGDGGTANSAVVSHTFQQTGSFTVTLTVGRGANTSSTSRTFNVSPGTGETPLGASFQTSAACNGNTCSAQAGQAVTFTSTSTGSPTSQAWSFGDGGSGSGASVTHTFQTAGTFTVTLTIGRGFNTASTSRTFNVSGVVQPEASTIVLPWAAQSRGVLKQTSNLYVHNPGTTVMEIVLEFHRQGQPEANPPRSAQAIQPGATMYVADVLKGLFNVENSIGFVTITKVRGDRNPVMTSFNSISGKKGSQFGQTVPGVALSREGTAAATAGSRMQYLVGLSDNKDRQAYFGITNPNAEPAVYRLKFSDTLGRPIGTASGDLTLPGFGAKQYQLSEIRSLFGIATEDDYRVEVETVSGKQLYPYGTNVQTVSKDPSYQGAGQSKEKLYLIGAMRTKGLKKSEWQSDIVLSNTGAQVALADVSFLNAGPASQPTAPLKITLQPGQTERLENVGRNWNVKDSVGLLTIESDSPSGVFPVAQGESYLSTKGKPGARYGLAMAAFTDEDAAEAGEAHYLAGLRHDANNRTTVWVYNNSNEAATYDLIYRGLNGAVLGRIDNVALGAGKLRQFSPSQHPLKAIGKKRGGVPGGFTLQVVVKSGKVLAAAQVVNNKTNDPSYVQGQAQ